MQGPTTSYNLLVFNRQGIIVNLSKVERRSDQYRNSQGETFDAVVVRQGLILKLESTTVSAIEYMQNHGISADTIERVLSGNQLREGDKLAMLSYSQQ